MKRIVLFLLPINRITCGDIDRASKFFSRPRSGTRLAVHQYVKFVVATKDYAGLGFAVRLQDEGHDVILATNPEVHGARAFDLVGQGMIAKAALSSLIESRAQKRDWYWIWDFNHSVEQNELLRSEGFRVLGGGAFADTMEHDRAACLDFTSRYGLNPPPSFPFCNAVDAIRFCAEHPHTAYVCKPDHAANKDTYLPESHDAEEANLELRNHLSTVKGNESFILQERKEGVETNIEVWFQNGEPVFAFMDLECKKRMNGDLGDLIGCAFDFAFTIPLDSKGIAETVGKLYPAYREMKYTGFGDANFIAARDGIWFLEKCERFGYNAHVNLLFNLARTGVGEILASLTDGRFEPCFSGGFGATVTMSTRQNPVGGHVVQFPPRLWKDIFFWDVYKERDLYLTAGYEREGYVLLVNGYGYTIPTAWENAMRNAARIKFPDRAYRTDGDRTDYPQSPVRRYEALRAMGYI
jgi:phosphoribosylamine-glycine ligase